MGFMKPTLPTLDYRQWSTEPRMARLKPMVLHWATNGFGTPDAVYFLYQTTHLVKVIRKWREVWIEFSEIPRKLPQR